MAMIRDAHAALAMVESWIHVHKHRSPTLSTGIWFPERVCRAQSQLAACPA